MAKAADTIEKSSLEQTVEVLTEALTEMRRLLNASNAEIKDLKQDVAKLQATVQLYQSETVLPREVLADLSPGHLYTAALQAFIIGYIGSNPTLLMQRGGAESPHKLMAVERALDFGDLIVKAMQQRFGLAREEAKR
jgi:hypothetical protein